MIAPFTRSLFPLCALAATAFAQTSTTIENQVLSLLLDPSSTKVCIAAHRGGYETDREDKAPENSLANIDNCAAKGYELFETDIQRTKDGHFVIVHDPTIERETSGTGKVSEMTLQELKSLSKRYRDGSLSSERVATLEEFLKRGRGRLVFKADLKPGVSQHFPEIMQIVANQNATEDILFRVPYSEADLYERFQKQGTPIERHTLMFKVGSQKQVDDVKARFDSTTIEIKLNKNDPTNDRSLSVIRHASERGFLVETHAEGKEKDWLKLIDTGVRMFHARAPSRLKALIQ